ncbi:DNA-binding PadR family transcriptional regulator [Arthrobacter ulcerisalmonis]|uniref:PadR family transcriptional regulator n=1 Tax=Arthrobacter sp. B1I2 TaxID=3042263 RepID=UPI00277E55E8|nr:MULTISPECIES: PadR family transcriptional regulator [Arthrobacter]MDQ0663788.1 DNA-binding PadR family transcriptional regulator [Arthrobacter ulcerisalmonis]MDQ0731672.1 DNA-binding PadR family transcriptional regulator [Arthrobacter sp. B1I2]
MPPVFAHGALRLYLLALLESGPKHGYELIKALKDRSGGTYSPSAGTIYPRLGKLEEDGLVATEPAGRRTNYRITAAGLAELDRRREDLAGVENSIALSAQRLDVELMLQKFRDELCADLRRQARRHPISPVTLETVRTVLDEARVAIRSTLQS